MRIRCQCLPPDTPCLTFAARELEDYLSRMLPSEGTLNLTLRVESDESDLERFQVRLTPAEGEIIANSPRAILLAVYDLLRRLGCRFLAPGRANEIVPRIEQAALHLQYAHEARFAHRGVCIEGANRRENVLDFIDWLPKAGYNAFFFQFQVPWAFYARWYQHRRNPKRPPEPFTMDDARRLMAEAEGEIKRRELLLHKVGHGWTAAVLGREATSWDAEKPLSDEIRPLAAMVDGRRELFRGVPLNTNLCLSNPDAVERFVDLVANYAKAHPEADYLHIWLADECNNVCECDACRQTTPSDQYVALLNAIDARLTQDGLATRLVFLLYQELLWPPKRERLRNSNRFALMFAPISRSFERSYAAEFPAREANPAEGEPPAIRNLLSPTGGLRGALRFEGTHEVVSSSRAVPSRSFEHSSETESPACGTNPAEGEPPKIRDSLPMPSGSRGTLRFEGARGAGEDDRALPSRSFEYSNKVEPSACRMNPIGEKPPAIHDSLLMPNGSRGTLRFEGAHEAVTSSRVLPCRSFEHSPEAKSPDCGTNSAAGKPRAIRDPLSMPSGSRETLRFEGARGAGEEDRALSSSGFEYSNEAESPACGTNPAAGEPRAIRDSLSMPSSSRGSLRFEEAHEADSDGGALPPYVRNRIVLPVNLAENLRFLRAWRGMFDGDGFAYDYPLGRAHYGDFGYLHIARVIFEDVNQLRALGLNGYMSCQELRAGMPNFLPNYVLGRALMDAGAEFDEIVEEYFRALYGEGWQAARDFLAALSECQVCDYLNGKGPRTNQRAARKLVRAEQLCQGFKPAGTGAAWERLQWHARYVQLLARALRALAECALPRSQRAYARFLEYVRESEEQLQPWLDVYRVSEVTNRYGGLIE